MKPNLVLAITGASGAVYAVRLLEVLLAAGYPVHLSISPAGQAVLKEELDLSVDLENFHSSDLLHDHGAITFDKKLDALRIQAGVSTGDSNVLATTGDEPGRIHYCHYQDLMAPIASGSFLTAGMIVCPCSGGTLGSIAHAVGSNLIHRAAEVHLKERRKLILVPRETPLSLPQMENMLAVARAGAVVLPASPGFYHGAKSIRDLVDFVVGRVCDQLGITHGLIRRWGENGD